MLGPDLASFDPPRFDLTSGQYSLFERIMGELRRVTAEIGPQPTLEFAQRLSLLIRAYDSVSAERIRVLEAQVAELLKMSILPTWR